MPRGGVPSTTQPPPPSTTAIQAPPPPQPVQTQHVSPLMEGSTEQLVQQDGVDTSNLPPATAPPSHPSIDLAIPGMLDGRSILEVDVANMTEKTWRRPGSDISDWFNYGFDELTWEAYCYRRRELGEMANVLKANLINFTGMPEDQLSNLPPEVRQMVMTGMTASMNAGGPGPGMMGPGMMMDMSNMLGPMGMGMGMNGDVTMGNAMMQMQESAQQGVNVGVGATSTPEQMYQNIDNSANVATPTPGPGPAIRGGTPVAPVSYRGRGAPTMPRGRGFPVRGRVPAVPRPASPLPPNVPTGPRNQNKYKDRDGNAPAVDGLDYGGGGGGGSVREGGRTPSGEPEERSSSRKRRSSPGVEDLRGPKRR
ncbi:Fip1 domain containing protein [Amanita muscaria]